MAMLPSSLLCLMVGALGTSNSESFVARHRHRHHAEVSRIKLPKSRLLPAAALQDHTYHSGTKLAAGSNLAPMPSVALDEATLKVLHGGSTTPTPVVDVLGDTATANVDQAMLDAATASAEAIANAAEAEAAQGDVESTAPTNAPARPSIAVVQRAVKTQVKNVNATGGAQKDGSEDDDADDDSDDYDASESSTTSAPMPGDELESLTPLGKIEKARQQLQDNLRRQAEIAAAIAEQGNDTDFDTRVDEQVGILANETQTPAFANVLGTMRKEMRKFASPFYMEHLISEQRNLKALELELEAALENAQAGSQGQVMESHFQPSSTALRGGDAMFTAQKVTVPATFASQDSAASRRTTWVVTAVVQTMLVAIAIAH